MCCVEKPIYYEIHYSSCTIKLNYRRTIDVLRANTNTFEESHFHNWLSSKILIILRRLLVF